MADMIAIKNQNLSTASGKKHIFSAHRQYICSILEQYVDPWAVKYVAPTMAGDVEAAFSLSVALRNENRGEVVVAFWRARAPLPAFRALLSSVWEHDHRFLVAAAGNRRTLRAIFRYGRFDLSHLPDTVRVWRGTSRLCFDKASKGYSWTLNRDIACWFAMRFASKSDNPLVSVADVRRDSILYYSDDRGEQEITLFDAPDAKVDGDADDWKERYMAHAAELEAEWKIQMSKRPKVAETVSMDPEDKVAAEITAWLNGSSSQAMRAN